VEFKGSWVAMCHNCGTRAVALSPMPHTVEGLKQRLVRDRRWLERRSGGQMPCALPQERRVGERRSTMDPRAEWLDADDLIVEIIEVIEGEEESPESTRIAPVVLLENRVETQTG